MNTNPAKQRQQFYRDYASGPSPRLPKANPTCRTDCSTPPPIEIRLRRRTASSMGSRSYESDSIFSMGLSAATRMGSGTTTSGPRSRRQR